MATVGDLIVNLRADVAGFRSGMDQARRSLDEFGRTGKQTQSSIEELTSWVKGLAAVQFAEAGMRAAEFVKSITETGSQITNMSRELGLSVEGLQAFQVAGLKAGVAQDTINRSLEFFTAQIGKLEQGLPAPGTVAALKDLFGSLQAASAERQGMTAEQFVGDISKRLGEMTDQYKAAAEARELFGKGGERMISVDKQMADGIDKEIASLKEMGLILSREDIAALDKANTELSLMGKLLENELAEGLLKVIPLFEHNEAIKPLAFMTGQLGSVQKLQDLAVPRNLSSPWAPLPSGASNEMAAMSAHTPTGPAPWEAGGAPKPPLLDADAIRKAQEFATEYNKLIAQYRLDLDYQTRLRAAYNDSAAAVRALEVAHAGEIAAEKVRQDATRLGITAPPAKIEAARGLAEADEQAKQANADFTAFQRPYEELLTKYQEDIEYQERLRVAYGQGAEAVQALQIAHAGDLAATQELNAANKLGISISQEQLTAIYNLASADEQAKLQAQEGAKAENEFDKSFAQGLSKAGDALVDATTKSHNLKSAWQELSQGALAFSDDIEKMILKLLVINPLLNELMGKKPGEAGALPVADSSKMFGGLFNGGSAGPGGGAGGGTGNLVAAAVSGVKDLFGSSAQTDASDYANLGSMYGGLFAGATEAGASPSDITDFAQQLMPEIASLPDLPGFAAGGDFTVGGGGGIDSQLVAFRATPGERVMVRTPDAAAATAGGRASGPSVTINVSTPDANSFRQSSGQIIADAHRHLATAAARG